MKKSTIISAIAFSIVMLFSTNLSAQNFSDLDKSPMDAASFPSSYKVSDKQVKVIYSRPQLKGRDVNSLTPNGKVWRTGANEAVEITFYENKMFGDKEVKAGTYSMFTIPGQKEWTVILNSDMNVWGAYSYNEANDVARVTVPVTEDKKSLEAFSIAFDDEGTMHLGWDTLRVAVPIK
ncbi:DUF2911 domain-containing protein [Xanthomarina sp. F2636L]|uniref:DUF2911 domain-containing protein n=1 Tax=Xanthomarina sp. F2636L TaxID=2996018 RepID=UPI00225DD324|nr:DUF2911 domain-containing protein [Xanthomarina sp. F2636L]MCX7551997.1 DUF2911 domain-containing protein [Xanthomarina sp. F2636L]